MRHSRHRHDGGHPTPHPARAMAGDGAAFGRGGRGRHHGMDRHGGSRRRMFEGGELRLVLMLLCEDTPRHGYDFIREIETRTGGAYAPSPGVIYPTLTLLEDLAHVEARTDGARKLYALSETGRARLAENRAQAEAALERLDHLRLRAQATDRGPVFRAMNTLKSVLHDKLGESPDKDLVFAVADLVDEAARKIERL